MRKIQFCLVGFLLIGLSGCEGLLETEPVFDLDSAKEWSALTGEISGMQVRENEYSGGHFDVFGTGALILNRADTSLPFIKSSTFKTEGRWTSKWINRSSDLENIVVDANIKVYGQAQDMAKGWTKFSGNPLVASKENRHATEQTLLMDTKLDGNDQSLVKGTGKYEGQWLLIFNVGSWASGGWAMAVADTLAPLKTGRNPFQLIDPFPLHTAKGRHAPNDWMQFNGQWFAPDEARNRRSYMWTTGDFLSWVNAGRIRGIKGHDPGIAYDGELFYLFLEDGNKLQYSTAKHPLTRWKARGVALNVGDHTGDADLSYFNNRWHMFFDDGPHENYSIGHASTTAEKFPKGWQLNNDVFGPKNPDQGQVWDDPTPEGNSFGTGDPDIAIEGTTLYMTYERSVGIAWKTLDLSDDSEQQITVQIEIDTDGNGTADNRTEQKLLSVANPTIEFQDVGQGSIRFVIDLSTENNRESLMIKRLNVRYRDDLLK